MVGDFTVLILDDDEGWLARHERRLVQAGITCRSTQDGAEAIKIAKTDPLVKFALIDEILYAQAQSPEDLGQELQAYQGNGVIRQIAAQRSDIQVVVVTAAPKIKGENNQDAFRRETTKLRRQRGVVDIVHKIDIEENPNSAYDWIVELLKRPPASNSAQVVKPKVLIGLGFSKEEYEAIAEQSGVTKKRHLSLEPLLRQGNREKILQMFWDKAKEQSLFLEMPGSKSLDEVKDIKPSERKILEFLAKQTELQAEVIIRERDYPSASRKSKKVDVAEGTDLDPLSVKDHAYAYDDSNGRRQLRSGIQIEGRQEHSSSLKVAIHRLKQSLSQWNVGPAKHLFIHEKDGYRPQFELGIVVYAVKAKA
jgi:CheY-like chemotaxis protein